MAMPAFRYQHLFSWFFSATIEKDKISRVLKPGGVFIYDTLNRTFISKLVAIKIWQEWKRWSFMPANVHVWEMFIKPGEIKSLLQKNGFDWKEHTGSQPTSLFQK